MDLKSIDLHTELPEITERGVVGPTEVTVIMRYMASPTEASVLGSLLQPGSSVPPHTFWEALGGGEARPLVIGGPLTAEESSDIRLAETRAPWDNRMQTLFMACIEVLQRRWDADVI